MSIKNWSWGFVLALMVFVVVMSGCGGSKSGAPSLNGGSDTYRISSATEAEPFETDLIAGAGQNWPGSGTDVGTVYVWNDATNLYVKYETEYDEDDEFKGWTLNDVHLYVGTSAPGTVAPGQFPWKGNAGGGTEYLFTIPLSGTYPGGNPKKPGAPYSFVGQDVIIAAHAVTGFCEWIVDDPGDEGTPWGVPISYTIYAGNPNNDWPDPYTAGSVTIWRDADNLYAEFTPSEGECFEEIQFFIGTEAPPSQAGQWPWHAEGVSEETPLEFPNSYLFTIPIPITDPNPNKPINFDPFDLVAGQDYFVAMHVTTCAGETGMGWDGGEEGGFEWDENGNWKRYTTWFWNPGEPGEPSGHWECGTETAWGYGPHWFRDNGFSNWGWWFDYTVD